MATVRTEDIRNIALIGHGHSGKTLLAEAMLHTSGMVTRLGTSDDGTSTSDFDEEEKERKASIDAAVLHAAWKDRHVNLIDCPGFSDFTGQVVMGLSAVETAVLVINAAGGVEINARRFFDLAVKQGVAVAIVVNKCDAENVDLMALVGELQESFGTACKMATVPVGQSHEFQGVVDAFAGSEGDALADVGEAHQNLVECIVEADEALMERYFADEEISPEELRATFAKAMAAGSLIPVFFTSARQEAGVEELLDAVANCFPSPVTGLRAKAARGEGEEAEEFLVEADPAGKLAAAVFKITSDPFVGKLSFLRICRGTLKAESSARIDDERKEARFAQLLRVQGKDHQPISEAVAGDIVATSKIDELAIGRTVWQGDDLRIKGPEFPIPMYSLAVEPKSRGDEAKISNALSRLTDQDPTLKSRRDRQTGETVLSGLGDMHLNVAIGRMKRMFQVEVNTKPPKIPYLETISAQAEGHYRHKKQTGGAGQFGEVYLRVEPAERNSDPPLQFSWDIYGGTIPGQFEPAILKGVNDVMMGGPIAGFPMQDVKVSIYDGKHHPVDSKEVAFRAAGKGAFIDGVRKAKPALLEPIVNIEVTVPAENVGDITGDLSSKRGRVVGQEMLPGNFIVIKAQVPLAEVAQYTSQLKSVTGGRGSFAMTFSHYEPVPPNVQQQIVATYAKKKEEEEE